MMAPGSMSRQFPSPSRRGLLRSSIGLGAVATVSPLLAALAPQATTGSINDRMTGNLSPVHDPCIIRQGDTYHLFSTGHVYDAEGLLPWRTSTDLVNWTYQRPAMTALPDWAQEAVPGTRGTWAPDIAFFNDRFHLYYSLSTFGSNRSVIGLMTSPTLDVTDAAFGWNDQGIVHASRLTSDYNAIDSNVVAASDGRYWMSLGSFWTGIKMLEIDPATGKPKPDAEMLSVASRRRPGAIEAPYIIEREGWFYMFASFESCCQGVNSTYYTVVGRSRAVTGPYVDRENKRMMSGGGFLVLHADLDTSGRFKGPGHVAILRDPGRDYIVHHAYDGRHDGAPTLRIQPLAWTDDGWPVAV